MPRAANVPPTSPFSRKVLDPLQDYLPGDAAARCGSWRDAGTCSGGAGVTLEVAGHAAIAADPSEIRFDNDFEARGGRLLPALSGHGRLAKDYHAGKDRFSYGPSFCIQCGLCVRYCA